MLKNVWKSIATTLIGLAIIVVTLLTIYLKGVEWYPEGLIGVSVGLLLLLTPDTLLGFLKKFLGNKTGNPES